MRASHRQISETVFFASTLRLGRWGRWHEKDSTWPSRMWALVLHLCLLRSVNLSCLTSVLHGQLLRSICHEAQRMNMNPNILQTPLHCKHIAPVEHFVTSLCGKPEWMNVTYFINTVPMKLHWTAVNLVFTLCLMVLMVQLLLLFTDTVDTYTLLSPYASLSFSTDIVQPSTCFSFCHCLSVSPLPLVTPPQGLGIPHPAVIVTVVPPESHSANIHLHRRIVNSVIV